MEAGFFFLGAAIGFVAGGAFTLFAVRSKLAEAQSHVDNASNAYDRAFAKWEEVMAAIDALDEARNGARH